MTSPREWSVAFAKQAGADLSARAVLVQTPGIPQCQHLHFLQMSCEKLCKAFLCAAGSDPNDLQRSHGYVAKVLPAIARQRLSVKRGKYPKDPGRVIREISLLAREIGLLAPAVDDNGRRPDNCEYPWEDAGGTLRVPMEHSFPNLALLNRPSGYSLLKLVERTIADLSRPAGT